MCRRITNGRRSLWSQQNDDSANVVSASGSCRRTNPTTRRTCIVADALYAQNKYDDALGYFRKAQQFSPGDPLSARGLGYCLSGSAEATVGNPAYFDSALVYLKIARRLFTSGQETGRNDF